MPTKTSPKTTRNTMNTTKVTEPGSDAYMESHGYTVPTDAERAIYGRFVRVASTADAVFATGVTGSAPLRGHSPQEQQHTPQNEVVLVAVWQAQSERWRTVPILAPALAH